MFLTKAPQEKARSFDDIIAALDAVNTQTASGAYITFNSALHQPTVLACCRFLAEITGHLPIMVQEKTGGRWEEVEDHEALELLFRPNDWMTQHDLLSFLTTHAELSGNGYLWKGRDSRGRVRQLMPLVSDGVKAEILRNWKIQYSVSQENGFAGTFTAKEIFHHRSFMVDGYIGLQFISNCKEVIGLALKTEEHGARLFKNGAKVGMALKVPGELTEVQYQRLMTRIREQYTGTENAHKTMIIEGGGDIASLGMTSEDAQFLETRRFQKQEIASLFGIPLFLLNDTEKSTTWGTGLEQITKSFVRFSLAPRLNRLADTFNRELLPRESQRKTRFLFNTDAFTMGEFKERMEGFKVAIEAGVLSPNEAREEEGRNAREGGDDYVGMNNENETTDETA